MKTIIHAYKAGHQWIHPALPGLGDFIRGTCHLFERLDGTGCVLKVDISQTEFFELIDFDPSFFHVGEADKVAGAEEWFADHKDFLTRIDRFLSSSEEELHLCTNLGHWARTSLPEKTRDFVKKFYQFNSTVTLPCDEVIAGRPYELLSIRTGDGFVGNGRGGDGVRGDLKPRLFSLIEKRIIVHSQSPIVVISDSHAFKYELARRYNFIVFPHAPQHGSYGNALPVAIDIHLLRNSTLNWHINAWQPWWSGFSHYTCLLFLIPSVNFRTPLFIREGITSLGVLRISGIGRVLLAVGRVCSYPRKVWQAIRGCDGESHR